MHKTTCLRAKRARVTKKIVKNQSSEEWSWKKKGVILEASPQSMMPLSSYAKDPQPAAQLLASAPPAPHTHTLYTARFLISRIKIRARTRTTWMVKKLQLNFIYLNKPRQRWNEKKLGGKKVCEGEKAWVKNTGGTHCAAAKRRPHQASAAAATGSREGEAY